MNFLFSSLQCALNYAASHSCAPCSMMYMSSCVIEREEIKQEGKHISVCSDLQSQFYFWPRVKVECEMHSVPWNCECVCK